MPEPAKRSRRPVFVASAQASLAAWADVFDPAALPVLDATAAALADLRANEDGVDAHLLAETLASDPLATLKLLAHVSALRRGRDPERSSDTETVTEALVMLGIPPFFRAFDAVATVSEWLAEAADPPAALDGFTRVLERAHRAARFATAFAVHRGDHDAAVIAEAALLHDFAELLLWLRAPALAGEIAQRQAADPALRSARAQRDVLNIELPALQHALMLRWGLPDLLVQITDDAASHTDAGAPRRFRDPHQLRNVLLAIRIARHSASGWGNPALPDDIRETAVLLNLTLEPTERLLRDIDAG